MTTIQTKTEIISALQGSNKHMQEWFSAISAIEYFTRQGDTWSAADNVDHVIKAVKPIVLALKLPRVVLKIFFGRPQHSSRPYKEVCRIYSEAISKGAKASGQFLPSENPVQDKERAKTMQLQKAEKIIQDLISALEKWEDSTLDQCQLPHPIIGNLTMREMLFFTIHHNVRHASHEGD
ncbi:MAG TPA: DinB family protein [Anaerolineales bacterium]|nr:DinB family protein [Anaerolineales bacterium]